MKKLINFLVSRPVIVGLLIAIQLFFICVVVWTLSESLIQLYGFFLFLSIMMVIYIVNKQDNPSYKLAWCITILSVPLFGGVFYILFGGKKVPRGLRRNVMQSAKETLPLLSQEEALLEKIKKEDGDAYKQFNYVWRNAYFPVYRNSGLTYCKTGEEKYWHLLEELKKAEKFIFLEYFIIDKGVMWDSILAILQEKVKEGVDVRVMYDDAGCVYTLPNKYNEKLEEMGIRAVVFNPLKARLAIQMNNRDHRKIAVIDGKVGFVGGINLADEYINVFEKYGHWKDTAVMVKGQAVWSLTIMFLQFWNFLYPKSADNYMDFRYAWDGIDIEEEEFEEDGFVQPFSDSPTDSEEVGSNVHFNMVTMARDYIYIQTPYLVISYEMQKALCNAAKSGVDVRITVPHVPDKWYVHMVTRSNYQTLVEAGVKIYEYTPGFIHSKSFVSDDKVGLCGTTNMDFRSYYLHYECGVLFYKTKIISDMKDDYMDTLKHCVEITLDDCQRVKLPIRIVRALLNLLAPLM